MEEHENLTRRAEFATTHWSVVLAARDAQSDGAPAALETLCRTYWYPLYAFVRRQGYEPQDAQDLTQAYFAHLLSHDFLRNVSSEKGRFRSFLLTCLKRFLTNEWQKHHTRKRGGQVELLPLDEAHAERRYALEPACDASPDKLFERRWALTLLAGALARLRDEHVTDGRGAQFDWLKPYLDSEDSDRSYAQAGAERGLKPAAVASAVYRFRQRYRELVREEIAKTVAGPEELEDELRWLFAALS